MATNPTVGGSAVQPAADATQASPGSTTGGAPLQEGQLLGSYVRDICTLVIPALYAYLKTHAPTHELLVPAVAQLTQATQRHAVGDYGNAFWLAYTVYRHIAVVRTQQPDLPTVNFTAG
jgi:hypothetical protein